MAAKKNIKPSRIAAAQTVVTDKSKAAWDATKTVAAKPVVRDTLVLAGQASLCTLVALGTIKAVGAVANAMA